MSTIRRVIVEANAIVIILKTGRIERVSMSLVARMAIEPCVRMKPAYSFLQSSRLMPYNQNVASQQFGFAFDFFAKAFGDLDRSDVCGRN